MNRFIYILAQPNYFTEGDRGRVTHALGVIDGLTSNNRYVTVITGEGFENFRGRFTKEQNSMITCVVVKANASKWYRELLVDFDDQLRTGASKVEGVIVRYKSSKLRVLKDIAKRCKNRGVRSILELNSFYFSYNRVTLKEKIIKWVLKPLELRTVGAFDYTYVVSVALQEVVKSANVATKVLAIPNAAKVRKVDQQYGESTVRLVYLGKLAEYYDLEGIVKATMSSQNVDMLKLAIYGDGVLMPKLKALAGTNNLIEFHGRYNNEKLHDIVSSPNDIFILPYKANTVAEIGSPTKLFEYMSLKSPILTSDVGQAKHMVIEGQTGFIYRKEGDIFSIITRELDTVEKRKAVAEAAYGDLISNHTWSNRFKEFLSIVVDNE